MAANVANDSSLTLEQIEGQVWGDPPADASNLVKTVHDLRRKPVGQLNAEELRVLLSQQTGVDVIVPYALNVLEHNPLAEGDYYPGDLLVAVLKLPTEYWRQHADRAGRVVQAVAPLTAAYIDDHYAPVDVILPAIEGFRTRRP
jgi:hypothetical protein